MDAFIRMQLAAGSDAAADRVSAEIMQPGVIQIKVD
jgi:hypothetical protein